VPPSPAEHHEILRCRIDSVSSSMRRPTSREFEIECPCEAAGDVPVSLREARSISFKPVGPDVCRALGVDQLDVYLDQVGGAARARLPP
jgi:hypothetical protein